MIYLWHLSSAEEYGPLKGTQTVLFIFAFPAHNTVTDAE